MTSKDSIFPLKPELEVTDRKPQTIELFTEEGHQAIDALSSDTARRILKKLRDEPATKSDIADRVETSIQNAHYHLERLDDAGLVQVIGTHYSSRGMEMDVYAPNGTTLLIVGDDAHDTTTAGEPEPFTPETVAAQSD